MTAEAAGSRVWDRVALVLVLLIAIAYGAVDLFNLDLGLARATGEYIHQHGVPHANVFSSVHSERPFVDDKWLFHWLTYVCVDGVGPWFAVLVRIALLVALAAALAVPLRSRASEIPGASLPRSGGPVVASWVSILAMLALVAASERFRFRPELFTLLFAAVFARILLRPEPLSRREFFALTVMQVLWINLHGFFVLGPILAGAAAAGLFVDALLKRSSFAACGRRLVLVPWLVLVGMVNPYGYPLLHSPVRILLDLKGSKEFYSKAIDEFAPTFSHFAVLPTDLLAYRVLLGLTALALLLQITRARFVHIIPLAIVFAMSLDIRRNISVFAVVAAPIVAAWFADRASTWIRNSGRRAGFGEGMTIVTVLLSVAILFGLLTNRFSERDRLDREPGFGMSKISWPVEEVDFVLEHLPPDGLFNSFSFGSYLVGRSWPERRVFLDGNTSGYDVQFFKDYADFVNGRVADLDAYIDRYQLRAFLLKPGHPVTQLLLVRNDAVPLFLGRHGLVIGLRGKVSDDVLRKFDLRAAMDRSGWRPIESRPSTRLRRVLPVAEMTRAQALRAMGRDRDAIGACDAAARVNDQWYEPWLLRGHLLLGMGQSRTAALSLDEAAARAPGSAEVLAARGLAWLRMQKFDAAAEDLDAALALDDANARVWFWRALAAQGQGDVEEAVKFARGAVERDGAMVVALTLLAELEGR